MAGDRVIIGRIVKPHGIRGEVAVDVLTDLDGRFDVGDEVAVDGRPMTIASSRAHQGRMLVRFESIVDRTAAEGLRGAPIEADATDPVDSDRFFVHELVGLDVVDVADRPLGTVSAWIELPAVADYDLLEVVDGARTWLLPAAEDFVHVGDIAGTTVLRVVDPPEGLLELGSGGE